MIQPYSKSVARPSAARSAFTLIELLVVIGIIALISGIILVAVTGARSHASNARVMADLQAISTALEAYKADFGDYPASLSTAPPISGAEMLAWTMVGPYNVAQGTNVAADGKDGPGFRVGFRGSVYGPYLDPDKFLLPSGASSYFIKDPSNQPILYFRRVASPANNTPAALYNVADNATVGAKSLNRANSTAPIRFNAIAGREKATGPFLLWSVGSEDAFGPENPNDPVTGAEQVKSCGNVLLSGGQ